MGRALSALLAAAVLLLSLAMTLPSHAGHAASHCAGEAAAGALAEGALPGAAGPDAPDTPAHQRPACFGMACTAVFPAPPAPAPRVAAPPTPARRAFAALATPEGREVAPGLRPPEGAA